MKRTETTKLPKALMLASVASMIDLFNEDNINILLDYGYSVDVMANFEEGSITSAERVAQYKQELVDRGVGVYHVPIPRSLFKIRNIFSSYKMIKAKVDKENYNLVHCHSPIGGVVCRLACRKARKRGTKVIYTAHGFHFFKGAPLKNWILFYPVEKMCAKVTDILITINGEDYSRAKAWKSVDVKYVPGIGVHTDRFSLDAVEDSSLREQLNFTTDDFVFMSTGQISVRKNQEAIIRAISKINNPKIKYLIVGTGELEKQLKLLAKELNVENRIIFAGYRGDVNKLLRVVDAFIFPSLQEGLPVALMEAMASGLPVICSNIRGNTDLIQHGEGGYLVEPRDYSGYAEAMLELYDNYDNLEEMRSVNIETMKSFDTKVINEKMKKIYRV